MQHAAPSLTTETLLVLGVAAGALALFVWNRLRVDVVGILVMAALIVVGLVTPQQGISGFANEAMITVAAMFVLSAGLIRTGGVDLLGRWVARLAGRSELRLLVVSLAIVIPVSAFINNTPVVVVMIPLIMGISREIGAVPSRLFMPISFGSQMGGTLTLIGTSTNLLVAGLVLELGLPRIRLFDITPPALVLAAVGVVYLLTVGRWLTPVREHASDIVSGYELREYLSCLRIGVGSRLVGQTLAGARFGETHGLQVIGIQRGETRIPFPGGDEPMEHGDLLMVRGRIPDIAQVEEVDGLSISGAEPDLSFLEGGEGERRLAEVIVPPRSAAIGRTVKQLDFRARYGVTAIAIQRHGVALTDPIGRTRLESGDVLLVQGSADALKRVHGSHDLALLGAVELPARRTRKLKYALPILAAVVLLAALEVTTILVSAILGVVAMFLSGCLTPEEAYEEVDWMVLVLLGSIIPLGIAMQNTGAAEFLAHHLLRAAAPLGLLGTLAAFYLMTSLLTELISNNASAVVLTPVAVATALALDVSPMPFIVAVMFAASNSYMTPIGYQTNTFIYGPGGYRFSDFVRVGGPLNLLMVTVATFVIPVFFPF
jgi:di/tricarboxylate transporter